MSTMTEEEYLDLDRTSESKNEFYDGVGHTIVGGSFAHALILTNLSAELREAFKRRLRLVYVSGIRVRISGESYAYPDIAVVCGEPRFSDANKDSLINPTVLIEVFSPSTEAHDRGLKFHRYRQLESLQEYVLVSQSEPRVEIFRRQPSGSWLLSEFTTLDSSANFESLDCKIPLAEIYYQAAFPE
jgi:Uma2 family endonuclease